MSDTFRITDPLQLLLQLLRDNNGSLGNLQSKWMVESRLSMRITLEAWDCWVRDLASRGLIVFKPEIHGRGIISLPPPRRTEP